ncbi:MAG: YdcF family protein [Lachnospiraceae bacterium]|nr:YdcF family protein [Lachnospiraceae bacterium]
MLRESKNMTTGTGRKIVGGVFTALALILTGQVSFVMTRRIHKVAQPKVYRKNLFAEQMLSLMMILTSLDIMLGIFSKFKNRFMKVVGWIFRIIAYFSSAVVLFFSGKIIIGSLIRHRKKAEYAIVLGMALEGGRPSRDLIYRVDCAHKYMLDNPDAKLIVAGGNPDKNGITEAQVMKKLLLKRGVAKERIFLEDKSDSTKKNFNNSMEIISPDTPFVLITSNYHMNRAVKIAKKAGFHSVYRLPARSEFFPYATNVFWEVLHNINEYTGIVKDE